MSVRSARRRSGSAGTRSSFQCASSYSARSGVVNAPVLRLMERDPQFSHRMVSLLAERVRLLAEELQASVRLKGSQRLAAYLRQPGIVEGVERERQRNLDFFAARGVDGRVTVYGQEAGCGCNWTFGVDDMRRFGIEGVVAEEGYPVPLPGPGALPVVTLRLDGASGLPAPRED